MDSQPSGNYVLKSTAILTEHFGYVPIAVIDDIINSANSILYQCTNGIDNFLTSRYPNGKLSISDNSNPLPKRQKSNDGKSVETGNDESGKETVDVTEEIELGTAKFETLFESIVDKCFDKFELYVLRNLFVVPPDLIEGGWIRLAHHNGIDFRPESQPDHLNTNNQPDRSNAKKITHELVESEDGLDILDAQILSLHQQIQFHQTLQMLLKRQHSRIEALTDDFLEPVENACHTAFESLKTGSNVAVKPATVNSISTEQGLEDQGSISETLNEPNTDKTIPSKQVNGPQTESHSSETVINSASLKTRASYKNILPFPETVSYLKSQVNELVRITTQIQDLMNSANLVSIPPNDQLAKYNPTKDFDSNNSMEIDQISFTQSTPKAPTFSVTKTTDQFDQALLVDILTKRAVEQVGLPLNEEDVLENMQQSHMGWSANGINGGDGFSSQMGSDDYSDHEIEMAREFIDNFEIK